MKIQRGKVPTLDEVEGARSSAILGKLRTILQSGEFKRQDHFIERLLEEGFTSTDIASALLHHFQGGEGSPPSRPPRSEERARPERPPFREARDARREPWSERPPRRREGAEGRVPVPPRPAKIPAAVVKPVTTPRVKPLAIPPAVLPLPVQGIAVSAPPATAPEPKPVVRKTNPPPLPPQPPGPSEKPVAPPPKLSRRTPDGQTCLHINIGSEMGVALNDVVAAIQGETGLPAKVVGAVDIRERHLFVDVVAEQAHGIIAKLNRAEMKGRRLKVKVA
ncbi:MAG: DbpA RNA binding domain-containing protein [Verrucomicrobia bacterium]|nr:DbpA RNA binding domain-containing protein [Verrucomicrobiota bacterium]